MPFASPESHSVLVPCGRASAALPTTNATWGSAAVAFCLLLMAVSVCADEPQTVADKLPMTGETPGSMQAYDRLVAEFMHKWKLPGGQIAVVKDGRLVLVRGYGWADVEGQKPVQPGTRFRVASVSKPITSATVLRLVEQQRLDLDGRAFEALPEFSLADGADADKRLRQITIRQLLTHTAGWDRNQSFDPMFNPFKAAKAVNAPAPAEPATIIRFMLRQPLDFDPGASYAYSNFGYCLLGRLVEQATGKYYEQAVQELVLQPCGATRMKLGHTRLSQRADDETLYYAQPAEQRTRCVFPDVTEHVCWPDGGFYLEAMDAHGGWIASAPDLLRFVTALEGRRGERLLQEESLAMMTARPAPPVSQKGAAYYGLGWQIRTQGNEPGWQRANWWHTGSLPGTSALLVRTGRGMSWAALFNSRPAGDDYKAFTAELDALLWKAAGRVSDWPKHDLFGQYR
jgi:N-acyl-D-amino-acid deacylase